MQQRIIGGVGGGTEKIFEDFASLSLMPYAKHAAAYTFGEFSCPHYPLLLINSWEGGRGWFSVEPL